MAFWAGTSQRLYSFEPRLGSRRCEKGWTIKFSCYHPHIMSQDNWIYVLRQKAGSNIWELCFVPAKCKKATRKNCLSVTRQTHVSRSQMFPKGHSYIKPRAVAIVSEHRVNFKNLLWNLEIMISKDTDLKKKGVTHHQFLGRLRFI